MPSPPTQTEPESTSQSKNDEIFSQLLEALSDGKEEKTQKLDPLYYLALLSRRRWYFIIPFICILALGIAVAIKLPKIYEASTLILVQPQKVPSDYVRPVVTDDLEYRISSISQQINSRSNLEQIIEQFNLFSGEEHKGMFIEDKLANLRRRITVDVHQRSRREDPNSFSVSFQGDDPNTVMKVANTLADNFIVENLKLRESQVFTTDSFIENQLISMRSRLQELEKQLQDYRSRNMGGLPEQLDTNLQTLQRLEQQLTDRQEAIRDAKNRVILINQQMTELQTYQSQIVPVGDQRSDQPMDDRSRLNLLRQELSALENKYTDRHPDIQRLKSQIETLEATIRSGESAAPDTGESAPVLPQAPPFMVQQMSSLLAQRTEAQQEIVSLEADIPKLRREIEKYKTLIDETPQREQELVALQRDYENMTTSYKSLLDRKYQAEIALNLERTQSGEQFRILDRARVPTKPAKPNMRKIFVLIVGAAFGLGAGLIFVLEFLDTSFKSTQEAAAYLGLPLLAAFPALEAKRPRKKIILNNVMTAFSLLVALSLFGFLAIMGLKGVDPALELFHAVFLI